MICMSEHGIEINCFLETKCVVLEILNVDRLHKIIT